MLRRPTSAPKTLLYASESPAGAGPSWCTRTSLVAQTAGHASVAEVAHEAVARARLIPEDVRFVAAEVVADYGVVHGLRISFAVRIHRDHDPARDTGGPRGDVAREVVARNLHVPRAMKRDPDPREVPVELRGSTRARIVLDRVGFHLEATYRSLLKSVSFEEHASAVVVDRVSGDKASFSVGDVHAPRAARDVVAHDLGVIVGPEDDDARFTGAAYVVGEDLGARRVFDVHAQDLGTAHIVGEYLRIGRADDADAGDRVAYGIIPRDSGIYVPLLNVDPEDIASDDIVHDLGARTERDQDAMFGGFRAAYKMVVRDSGVDAPAKDDPVSDIAFDTVSHNSSVASGVNVDHERFIVLEAPEREARNAHIPHALVDLAGFGVEVAEDANSHQYAAKLRAGRARPGGRFDHGVALTAQLYPVLGDYHVLSVNSSHDDGVARMGSVDSLLDGLARPDDLVCRL